MYDARTPNRHKHPMTMQRKNYYLPLPLLKLLEKRMRKDGLSASELVRRALEAFLKN